MIDNKIKKSYLPMTETAFYILFSLKEPMHGYAIINNVEKLTKKRITLGAGTLYGSLGKMSKDRMINCISEESNRKIYLITELGKEVLNIEIKRITELYNNIKECIEDDKKDV